MGDINKVYQIILSAKDEATAVVGKLSKSLEGIETELTAVRNASAIAFAALAAGSGIALHAAIEAEQSMNLARASVKVAGQDFELYRSKLSEVTGQMQKMTMFQDDDLQRSFAQMVSITQDASGSLLNLGLVADLASGRNIDLATSAELVAKGMQGVMGRLGVLFPALQLQVDALGENATQADKAGVIIGYLTEHFKGMAKEAADSAAGGLTQLKNSFNELQEAIGGSLLGSLKESNKVVRSFIDTLTEWVKENQGLTAGLQVAGLGITGFISLAASLGTILSAVIAHYGSLAIALTKAGAAASGFATAFLPIAGIVATVGIVINGFYNAYTAHNDFQRALNMSTEEYIKDLKILKDSFPTDAVHKYKEALGLVSRQTADMSDPYGKLIALGKEWTPLLGTNTVAMQKYSEEVKKSADELARLASEMARMQLAHDNLGFQAPDWQSQVANLRGNRAKSNQGILPDEEFNRIFEGLDGVKKRIQEISPVTMQLAQEFSGAMGNAIGRVVSGLTSMARLTALSIKDIFRAIGEEILALFARVLAQLVATGILKLLLSILNPASLIIPTGSGGFPDAFGGSGLASIPRGGGGSLVPAIVNPSQSSFGRGGGSSSFALHIHGDFIGSDENIAKLEKVIARRMQYGQSNMGRN